MRLGLTGAQYIVAEAAAQTVEVHAETSMEILYIT